MKYNFKIIKAIPLILFFSIVLVSGLVLYQVKYNSKGVRVIKSQLIGKNIPLISIPEVNYKKINQENINLNLSNFKGKIFAINFFNHVQYFFLLRVIFQFYKHHIIKGQHACILFSHLH